MEQNCFFVFYYAHNHFQKVAVFTLQYVRTWSAQYMPSFLTVQPSHQHILYQNIFLHVRIERTANACYTGILQPLDAVAKLAHVAFSLLGWMSQCALASKAVDVDHAKEHIYHTQLTRHKSCQIYPLPLLTLIWLLFTIQRFNQLVGKWTFLVGSLIFCVEDIWICRKLPQVTVTMSVILIVFWVQRSSPQPRSLQFWSRIKETVYKKYTCAVCFHELHWTDATLVSF